MVHCAPPAAHNAPRSCRARPTGRGLHIARRGSVRVLRRLAPPAPSITLIVPSATLPVWRASSGAICRDQAHAARETSRTGASAGLRAIAILRPWAGSAGMLALAHVQAEGAVRHGHEVLVE